MLFSELTISYLDITFSIETLAVTYSKKFCFFRGINWINLKYKGLI